MRYYIIKLDEQNGEQEYYQPVVRAIEESVTDVEQWIKDNVLKGWYDNEDGEDDISEDGEYNFLNGQISVKIASYNEITLDEYNVLIKYI